MRKLYNSIIQGCVYMRLSKTSNKNNTTYFIIKDYTNLNGKRSTCVYEALGNDEKLKERRSWKCYQ